MAWSRRLFLAFSTLALAGPVNAHQIKPDDISGPGTDPVHFMMEDVNGTVVNDENLIGRLSLVFFGYTSCPDVCPTTLATIAAALKAMGSDGDKILPLFISLDPARDTRKVLSDYVANFDPRIVGLRGPKDFTDATAKSFGVDYEIVTPDPAKPQDYSVDHSASIILVGPDAIIIKRYGHSMPAEDMAKDLQKILGELKL